MIKNMRRDKVGFHNTSTPSPRIFSRRYLFSFNLDEVKRCAAHFSCLTFCVTFEMFVFPLFIFDNPIQAVSLFVLEFFFFFSCDAVFHVSSGKFACIPNIWMDVCQKNSKQSHSSINKSNGCNTGQRFKKPADQSNNKIIDWHFSFYLRPSFDPKHKKHMPKIIHLICGTHRLTFNYFYEPNFSALCEFFLPSTAKKSTIECSHSIL